MEHKWHYDSYPDLSGNKSIRYYVPGGGLHTCPAKSFFENTDKEYLGNHTWQDECNKLKAAFNSENKLFYCYYPDYFFYKGKKIKTTDGLDYERPERDDDSVYPLASGLDDIGYSMIYAAQAWVTDEICKYLPDDLFEMYDFFVHELS